jgi:hypothetical protein
MESLDNILVLSVAPEVMAVVVMAEPVAVPVVSPLTLEVAAVLVVIEPQQVLQFLLESHLQ